MAKPIITNYSVEEMESMLMSNPDYQIGMRLMACIQIAKGTSSRKLQEFYYKSHSRYLVWANRFNAAGIEGLKNLPGRGRKPKLSNEDLKAIRQIVLKESPGEYGYNTETWTGPLLIDFIKKEFAVEYKKAAIYVILKNRLGLSYQKGKGFFPESDSQKREEFVNQLKKTSGNRL